MNPKKIGKKLKLLRNARGLSREELASLLGVSVSAITMWELGERVPQDDLKLKITEFFEVDMVELFFKEECKHLVTLSEMEFLLTNHFELLKEVLEL